MWKLTTHHVSTDARWVSSVSRPSSTHTTRSQHTKPQRFASPRTRAGSRPSSPPDRVRPEYSISSRPHRAEPSPPHKTAPSRVSNTKPTRVRPEPGVSSVINTRSRPSSAHTIILSTRSHLSSTPYRVPPHPLNLPTKASSPHKLVPSVQTRPSES